MIDLTIPPGRAPDVLVNRALVALVDEVNDTRDLPHELEASIVRVRYCQNHNDVVGLDKALVHLGAATHSALVRLRADHPDLVEGTG